MPEVLFSADDLKALASKCWRSPSEFCRVYLPNWFPRKMPWVHRGLCALMTGQTDFLLDFGPEFWSEEEASWTIEDLQKILDNFLEEGSGKPIFELSIVDGEPRLSMSVKSNIAVIMPRGFSKTTLVNAMNLRDLVYQNEDFFLYVSESGAHAERQLGTVKSELEDNNGLPNNELLHTTFGSHAPGRQSPLKWTENYIETLKGIMVGAVGRGGQIRGFGKRAKRPGKIVFDDIEDEESVQSDTQRKKDSSWFFNAAMPAIRKGGRIFAIGTLLHTDAILNKLIKSSMFTAVRFGAIDRQGLALWSFMLDLEGVEEKKRAAAEVGELPGFFMEYMSEVRTDESRMFPESKIIYLHKGIENFIGIAEALDPAISDDRKADMCAFAVVGIEAGGQNHVLDFHGQVGMDPFDIVDKYFELHFKWLAHLTPDRAKHGIEAIAFQRALVSLVRADMFKRSRIHGSSAYFEIEPIFHGKIGKVVRIKGILKPKIHAGYLTFEERWPDLHNQLTEFPNAKLKDGPDVVAMAVRLLDPYAALGLGDEGLEDLTKDSAPPLEMVIGGNYRSAP